MGSFSVGGTIAQSQLFKKKESTSNANFSDNENDPPASGERRKTKSKESTNFSIESWLTEKELSAYRESNKQTAESEIAGYETNKTLYQSPPQYQSFSGMSSDFYQSWRNSIFKEIKAFIDKVRGHSPSHDHAHGHTHTGRKPGQ